MKNESHHHDNACNENTRLEYFEIWLNKNKNITTSLKFIKTLKKGISILLFPNISSNRMFLYNSKYIPLIKREDLSKFLGQKNSHIKELTRRATINPNYKIGLEFLQEYEFNMKKEVNKNNIAISLVDLLIDVLITNYIESHNPPFSNRYKSKKFHPKLIENYFKTINTVEKAYWLGLLWADGWISDSADKYTNFYIGLKQSEKNYDLIKSYCLAIGYNLKYLRKYQDKKYKTWAYLAIFMNNRFAKHLTELGFIIGNKKSLTIQLPELNGDNTIKQEELYLGFLLGYYDGDGTTGRTTISSGSKKLIKQIRDTFNITNKILEEKYDKKDGTRGIVYRIQLGRDLITLMLFNYGNSFKLKRKAIGKILVNSFDRLVRKEQILLEKGEISEVQFIAFNWKLGQRLEFSYELISSKCKRFYVEPPLKKNWEKTN